MVGVGLNPEFSQIILSISGSLKFNFVFKITSDKFVELALRGLQILSSYSSTLFSYFGALVDIKIESIYNFWNLLESSLNLQHNLLLVLDQHFYNFQNQF